MCIHFSGVNQYTSFSYKHNYIYIYIYIPYIIDNTLFIFTACNHLIIIMHSYTFCILYSPFPTPGNSSSTKDILDSPTCCIELKSKYGRCLTVLQGGTDAGNIRIIVINAVYHNSAQSVVGGIVGWLSSFFSISIIDIHQN